MMWSFHKIAVKPVFETELIICSSDGKLPYLLSNINFPLIKSKLRSTFVLFIKGLITYFMFSTSEVQHIPDILKISFYGFFTLGV